MEAEGGGKREIEKEAEEIGDESGKIGHKETERGTGRHREVQGDRGRCRET